MSLKNKGQIWNGAEDLRGDSSLKEKKQNEFFNLPILNDLSNENPEEKRDEGPNRRDFLKYVGFSIGAAAVAASCETPIRKAIPYVTKPDAIVPGVATYYASSFYKSGYFCPVLVKTREGRPIKIEGNTVSGFSGGGTSARVQASVLDLYDRSRYKNPSKKDGATRTKISWDELDEEVKGKLASSNSIRLVANSIISPSYKRAIQEFQAKYTSAELVTYDPISSSAILLANEKDFGSRFIPGYDFSKADLIVSFGADFLGTWISPVQFAHQYAKNRKIDPSRGDTKMNKLVAIESNMSLTGSNADQKVQIRPSEQGLAIATLYNFLNAGPRVNVSGNFVNPKAEKQLQNLANELKNSSSSLIVSDSNNTSEQQLINRINQSLGNYEKSIITANPLYVRTGVDKDIIEFKEDLNNGKVDTVILLDDANPVYDTPWGKEMAAGLEGVNTVISCSYSLSESSETSDYQAPVDNYLESWSDLQPSRDYLALVQPTIERLFDTRSAAESLLVWAESDIAEDIKKDGDGVRAYYNYIKETWESTFFPSQNEFGAFQSFWENSLHNGFFQNSNIATTGLSFMGSNVNAAGITKPVSEGVELKLYEPVGVGSGTFANNPWIQEMPDPITRVVWDNVLHVPIEWNGVDEFTVFNGLDKDGSLVNVNIGETLVTLPTVQQFGQYSNTVAAALGYGRKVCGKAGQDIGRDFYPVLPVDGEGNIQYFVSQVDVSDKVGEEKDFAIVQYHHTMGVTGPDESEGGKEINVDEKAVMHFFTGFQGGLTDRTIIRHSTIDDLEENIEKLKEERAHAQHLNEQTLYPGHDDQYSQGHHWGMAVDLTSCIGCGACQVACVAENNVPIVGKHEVHRHHEMTWLRIDRYYYGDVENPNVVYQPMMCQHCDNAPCENVCPVAATNHSSEGLNQMAYNRCVGTRYCANNCPYKVRRFNWLDYTTADIFPVNENNPMDEDEPFYADNLVRMVLNPDVTVRSRGVIEKCSMCVQRIQEGKLKAKVEGRALRDGEVKPACQTACPTGGILFGDMNDKDSELNKRLQSPMNYYALEEVNTRSSVGYQMKVLNKPAEEELIES
ncbi:TAT-variant-translocated molybdopterin oxidoreductase [Membranihabitans maritimus]|uniref:TAT-variant-translocated molybdopterin oxidoreductase n=1 Tax=Membranihabitans maritimus TaxID=2904244 RepID=UPI001F23436E|nr:TAT-variant-translocated molybdopterin oxidoreductase [Membranihabitans maritimus]